MSQKSEFNGNQLPNSMDFTHPSMQRLRRSSMITLPSDLQRFDPLTQQYYTVQQPTSQLKKQKIYALRIASTPGIYHSWATAKALIDGCPGAKYKGFSTIPECMQFFWEQFPNCQFTQLPNGDYVMTDPEPVYQVIEEARAKKEKNAGVVLVNDISSFDPNDTSAKQHQLLQSHPNLLLSLNDDQQLALDAVKQGRNVFISGRKSTGKDVLLSHICKHLTDHKKHFHVTSASSIVSLTEHINYTIGWTGMGKALGTKKQILNKVRKNVQVRKKWADTDVLIIKDVTMLSGFMFDLMDYLAREIRKSNVAFGGMQIVLVGDGSGLCPPFMPTICCPNCGTNHKLPTLSHSGAVVLGFKATCAQELCKAVFLNTWLLYPFETDVWNEAQILYFPLRKNYIHDQGLNKLMDLLLLGPPVSPMTKELLYKRVIQNEGATVICPTVDEANRINDEKLQALNANGVKYEASDTVLNNFDFASRAQQKEGLTDEILMLKVGMRVLVIPEQGRFLKRGVVVGFVSSSALNHSEIVSQCAGIQAAQSSTLEWLKKHTLVPKVRFGDGNEKVIPCRVFIVHAMRKAVAWRIQLPLRPAYAVPLYKCHQVSGTHHWLPGQMLAAINLARDLNALYLSGFEASAFEADSKVLQFEFGAKQGEVCKGVKDEKHADVIQATAHSLKRNSLAGGLGTSKKRRGSQASTSPTPKSLGIGSTISQYNNLAQRRHSYAPLTSFQEQQQIAWLQQQQLVNTGIPYHPDKQSPASDLMFQSPIPLDYTPTIRSKLGMGSDLPISQAPDTNSYLYPQLSFNSISENSVGMILPGDMVKPDDQALYSTQIPNRNTNFMNPNTAQFTNPHWQWNQQH